MGHARRGRRRCPVHTRGSPTPTVPAICGAVPAKEVWVITQWEPGPVMNRVGMHTGRGGRPPCRPLQGPAVTAEVVCSLEDVQSLSLSLRPPLPFRVVLAALSAVSSFPQPTLLTHGPQFPILLRTPGVGLSGACTSSPVLLATRKHNMT